MSFFKRLKDKFSAPSEEQKQQLEELEQQDAEQQGEASQDRETETQDKPAKKLKN